MTKKAKIIDKINAHKISMHAIKQELGITKNRPLEPFDNIIDRALVSQAEADNIITLGWELTYMQRRGVDAILKIAAKNGYIDNHENYLLFTPGQFYEAFELIKHNRNSKMVYSNRDIAAARKALYQLNSMKTLASYYKKEAGGYKTVEIYSAILPELILMYHELDEPEPSHKEKNTKLKYIMVRPSIVLREQIKNYYAVIPDNLYTRLKSIGVKDSHTSLFIHWLAYTVSLQKGGYEGIVYTEIGLGKLALILKMDALIKDKQKKLTRNKLVKIFKDCKTLGYLKNYKISPGVEGGKVGLTINVNEFRLHSKVKAIKTVKGTERIVFNDEGNVCRLIPINAPLPEGYREENAY